MRQLALAGLLLAALVGDVAANGRPFGTSTITFRPAHDTDIVAGLTFGVVVSHDGGISWQWVCEKAVGYGGMYDPDFAYLPSGTLFATSNNGVKVNRDGCTYDPTAFGLSFGSSEEVGPDGALYIAMSDPIHDHSIYKSTDDGMTFPQIASPGQLGDWWENIKIAPSDPSRVYLFGYRFESSPEPDVDPRCARTQGADPATKVSRKTVAVSSGAAIATRPFSDHLCDNAIQDKAALLFSSSDGGATFNPLPQSGCSNRLGETACTTLMFSNLSRIQIAGISPTNPDLIFLRVTLATGAVGDVIYRSTDGGATWTEVLSKGDSLAAFVVRANGDVVAGTPTLGAVISHDNGDTWIPLVDPPHLQCLVENAEGELWGCTQNFGTQTIPGDGYGIMRTTDLVTWTPVLKYQDIASPVSCPTGTIQHDVCQVGSWCTLETQVGITSTAIPCAIDDMPMADVTKPVKSPAGCCDAGGDSVPPVGVAIGVVVGIVLRRPRRRRS